MFYFVSLTLALERSLCLYFSHSFENKVSILLGLGKWTELKQRFSSHFDH